MALRLPFLIFVLIVLVWPDLGYGTTQPVSHPNGLGLRRVLLLGDSNIFGALGKHVEHEIRLRGHDVIRFGKPTSGLARPDFFDWTQVGPELIRQHQPDIVIIMFGGNDGQRLAPYRRSGKWIPWTREPQWCAEYAARVLQLAQLLRGSGREVWFLSPTNRRPQKAREKMRRILDVQRSALRGLQDVRWIDVFSLSSETTGAYLSRVPTPQGGWVSARRRDGIHLSEAGGRVVGGRIISHLSETSTTFGEN